MLYSISNLHTILQNIPIQKSLPILLYGDMGAGKTTLSKLIIQHTLNIAPHNISSPTFNIINVYTKKNINIHHCDLSRVTHPNDPVINDILESIDNNIYIIEWPEVIEKYLSSFVAIKIHTIDENTRNFTINIKK